MPDFKNLAPQSQFQFGPDPFGMPALANAMRFKNMFSAMSPAGSFGAQASSEDSAPGIGPAMGAGKPAPSGNPTPPDRDGGTTAPAPGVISDPYKPPVPGVVGTTTPAGQQPPQTTKKFSGGIGRTGGLDYVGSYSPGST